MTAKRDTRFQPGQSGNPSGRPHGSRSKHLVALDNLAEGAAEAILKQMIEKAKGGDVVAGSRILERVWPPRKGGRFEIDLPSVAKAEDLPAAFAGLLAQMASGTISPDEGAAIAALLESQRKAIETSDLAARLTALEERAEREASRS